MEKRYLALRVASSSLKFASLIVVVCGVGASFWFLSKTDLDTIDILLAVGGILVSIVAGILVFALAEFFYCVIGIEANTRINANTRNQKPLPD